MALASDKRPIQNSQLSLFDQAAASAIATTPAERKRRRLVIQADLDDLTTKNLIVALKRQLWRHDRSATISCERSSDELRWVDLPFLCLDTETTGLDKKNHRVIEIAWILFEGRQETESCNRLCQIDHPLPAEITQLTGITDEMLSNEKPFSHHAADLLAAMSKASFIVAYNANFDRLFVEAEMQRLGLSLPALPWIDPCVFIREIDRYQKGKKLQDAAKRWGIELNNAHRALADARATGQLLYRLAERLRPQKLSELLTQQNSWQQEQEKAYRDYLAKTAIGV